MPVSIYVKFFPNHDDPWMNFEYRYSVSPNIPDATGTDLSTTSLTQIPNNAGSTPSQRVMSNLPTTGIAPCTHPAVILTAELYRALTGE